MAGERWKDARGYWRAFRGALVGPAVLAVFLTVLLYCLCNAARSSAGGLVRFFDVAGWPVVSRDYPHVRMLGDAILYIGILAIILIVAWNTRLAARGLRESIDRLPKDCAEDCQKILEKVRRARWRTLMFLDGIIGFLVAWFVIIAAGKFHWLDLGRTWSDIREEIHVHELIAWVVFVVFLVIDVLIYRQVLAEIEVCRSSGGLSKPELKRINELESERRFQAESIWLIDVPVCMGVLALMVVSSVLHANMSYILANRSDTTDEIPSPPGYLDLNINDFEHDGRLGEKKAKEVSQQRQRRRFEGFLVGFSAGGIIMHVAMSQVIFAMIYGFYRKRIQE